MAVAALRFRAAATSEARRTTYFHIRRPAGTLPALDGLRAIAIVLVLFRHAVRPFHPEGAPLLPLGRWDLATPLVNGWMGVDLFFVLSGFLIAHHIRRRYGRRSDAGALRDYLMRRALRIVPAYYAVLLLAVSGAFPLYPVAPDDLGRRLGYHMLFMQDYLPADILVVFWSLGVEEKFYLLAPVLLTATFALRRRWMRYAALGALALTPSLLRAQTWLGSPPGLDYESFFALFRSPFHLSFDGLAVGMLCALVYGDRAQLGWTRVRPVTSALFWSGAILVGGLLCATPLLAVIGPFQAVALQAVLALGMGAMVLGVALGGGPQNALGARALFVVSTLSYALYLVHYALIPGVLAALAATLDLTHLPRALQLTLFLPPYLLVSFAVAAALHYAVEKPFLLLRQRHPARA